MHTHIDPSLLAEIEYRQTRARRYVEHEHQAAEARRARRRERRSR